MHSSGTLNSRPAAKHWGDSIHFVNPIHLASPYIHSYILPRFHKFLLPVLRGTLGKKNLNNYSGSKLEYKHCKFILFSLSSSCVTKIYDGVSLSCNLVLSCNCSCCDCHLVIWGLSERVPVEHCCAIHTNKPSILLIIALAAHYEQSKLGQQTYCLVQPSVLRSSGMWKT